MLRPRGVNMHYEVELGLIIGKTLRDLHPDDTQGAMDAISGNFFLSVIGPRLHSNSTHMHQVFASADRS